MPYILTPQNDPTAFEKDGVWYHMCDLPMHMHNVAFPYADCNEEYWAGLTEDQKKIVRDEARKSAKEYFNHG